MVDLTDLKGTEYNWIKHGSFNWTVNSGFTFYTN